MDFLAIDRTLTNVLNVISGVGAANAADASQPGYFPRVGGDATDGRGNLVSSGEGNTLAKVTYDFISIGDWGFDEWRTRYDATAQIPGDTYQPDPAHPSQRLGGVIVEATGVREITVQVKVECFDQSNGKGAWPILERIRMRLKLPTILDTLRDDAGLGIQTIGKAQPADYDDDNSRRVSCAFFEVIFNTADSAEDDPITTIEQVTAPTPGAGLTVTI